MGDQNREERDSPSCVRSSPSNPQFKLQHPDGHVQPLYSPPTSFHNIKLTWDHPPSRVLIVGKIGDADTQLALKQCASSLQARGLTVVVEPAQLEHITDAISWTDPDELNLVDFVVCIGGDGTVLHSNSLFPCAVPPVIAFHSGSLGFLASFQLADFEQHINDVLAGNQVMTLRRRLKASIYKAGQFVRSYLVLNEVVVDRGPTSYITKIECVCNDSFVTTIQGDGVIVSTSTGSTAYSLSAGGSMLHPLVPAFILTPICPHSLSFRPIVLPDSVTLKLKVAESSRGSSWVAFDGRGREELCVGDWVVLEGSVWPFPTIALGNDTSEWFMALARCLSWNVRVDQKSL